MRCLTSLWKLYLLSTQPHFLAKLVHFKGVGAITNTSVMVAENWVPRMWEHLTWFSLISQSRAKSSTHFRDSKKWLVRKGWKEDALCWWIRWDWNKLGLETADHQPAVLVRQDMQQSSLLFPPWAIMHSHFYPLTSKNLVTPTLINSLALKSWWQPIKMNLP